MNNLLRNGDISGNNSKKEFSSNFIFDQIIKQKIFEIEKINPIRVKADKRGLKDNVIINKK
jgi:hypothetical protein